MITRTVTSVNAGFSYTLYTDIYISYLQVLVYPSCFSYSGLASPYTVLLSIGKARTFHFFHKLYQMCYEVPS